MALMYCKECDMQISSNARYCPFCGCKLDGKPAGSQDICFGYLTISFLIPVLGIILYFVYWNKDEGKSKSALIGTLMSVVYVAVILLQVFGV